MRRLGSYVENASAHSEHDVPAHSGQHVQAQSGQHVRAHSEQGSGQRVQAHSGQSFPARSQSRPDKQIRLPSQSRLHSPTQSGESTRNEPLQLSAQSRQHTPEAQSHPSTLNVSSTAANDDVCWNLGSTQRDGRLRVEVIKKIRGNRIGLNVYLSWVEFWKTEDFQKKSLIQRGNRRSRVDGPLRHTSGSASHGLVAPRLIGFIIPF
ncbi:hypothetical protein POM88_034071 [Heracleum sosnowskyi]|uniref:Uncharacterized protein n=1 Tax=Heracleum sosnowskyi TaxID=360622 RepID=A0AAD8HKJ5_9APIA|nr:hypothetical protein POM88_034071 [Heracleum sosnowskyi]